MQACRHKEGAQYRLADKKKCSVHLVDTKKVLSSGLLTKRRCSVQASRYKKRRSVQAKRKCSVQACRREEGAQCRLKKGAQCRLADVKRLLRAGLPLGRKKAYNGVCKKLSVQAFRLTKGTRKGPFSKIQLLVQA